MESQRGRCPRSATLCLRPERHQAVRLQPAATSVWRALLTTIADDELIKKRRLGQTTLTVKPGLVGTSNSTKPENLGPFDYAHLRAPLPDNLKGSEIFAPHANQSTPEVYFLMVCPIKQFWPLYMGGLRFGVQYRGGATTAS